MHGHRWLTLSLLLSTVATTGCGGGGGGSGAPSYTLSGTVTLAGHGHSGATVSLTGPVSRTTATGSTGTYSFGSLPAGAYSVVPTLAGQVFDPGSAAVAVSADVTGVDFALIAHALSGAVTVNGQGQAGVQVSLSGSASATTTSGPSGEFSFPALLSGPYVVTPSLSGQTYPPSQRGVSVDGASSAGNDFAMDTYALSGRVTWNGSGYALGGTVLLTGGLDLSTELDPSGSFSFAGLPNGSYTVTPLVSGQSLSPAFLVRTVAGAPSAGNDLALVTYAVRGRVLDRGAGLPDVPLSLAGAAAASTATGASGDYSFDGLLNGDYLVTPAHASLAFTPASLGAVVSYASADGVDFQTSPVEPPTFGTRPGTYADPQSVTLACATPGVTIRYTTDGTTPSDAAGTVYAGPIAVTTSTVIRAVAYRDGWVTSPEAAALYTISPVALAAGRFHSLALRADGTTWAWGDNTYGQLGDGTTASRSTRVWVPGLWGATAVATGQEHSLALVGGTVWTWGFNYRGQLGDGTTTDRKSPAQVPGLAGVVGLAGGSFHSAALRDDGTVWTWGDNAYAQLGDGTTINRWTPVQAPGLTGIVAIAAGALHTLALASDGTVWAWGSNDFGQLGDGTTTQRLLPVRVAGLTGAVAIAIGEFHSMALASDGTVWTWGAGRSGALGDASLPDRRLTPGQVAGLPRTLAVAAGGSSCLALGSDGTTWSWGYNYNGQLGDGSRDDRPTPAQVSIPAGAVAAGIWLHGLVVNSDGSLWAFGENLYGELGDATTARRLAPVRVWGMTGPVELASGAHHTVVAKADGTVWGWGQGSSGQLGNGIWQHRSAPVRAIGLSAVVAVAAGRWHTVALRGDGTVWTWGANNYLQLGDTSAARSEAAQVPGLTGVVAVAAGGTHTLALREDGTVWAWGYNFYGQVGDGTTTDRSTPAQVSGLSGAFVAIAGGYYHSLAVKGDGTVWFWGGVNLSDPPGPVGTPPGMVRVCADGSHSGGLRSDGTVWGWGANGLGALGDGTTIDRLTPVQAVGLTGVLGLEQGFFHAVARASDQTVRTWGGNAAGQLGDGTLTDRLTAVAVPGLGGILAVSAGEQHTSALAGDGTVWSWGYNIYGQLGDGTTTNRPLPITVAVP